MRHILKNAAHLKIWLKLGKSDHTCKNGSHLKKCGTLEKMGQILKMRQTWKSATHRKNRHTWKN